MNKHLLDVDSLSTKEILEIFKLADDFKNIKQNDSLKGKIIIMFFSENSTRTKSSFEIVCKKLGAKVIDFNIATSSSIKGESIKDTALNLNAMNPDAVIIRHSDSGIPNLLSKYMNCSIINAGDGLHAHPTQALLDYYTMKKYIKGKIKIAIVGDIKNSRVANSNIKLLQMFNEDISLIAPPQLMPNRDIKKFTFINEVINNINVLMSLRTQVERHNIQNLASLKDYATNYCITNETIQDKDLILMHPGPVNRNVDISDNALKNTKCKVLEQVENGVLIRLAILSFLLKPL
jgi:aspartate carbamoyltransferase catalytic subunit